MDEGGVASVVLQGDDVTLGHQDVFQLILELEDIEIGTFLRPVKTKIPERLLAFLLQG